MNVYRFNTARNALCAFLQSSKIKEVYIPYEICPVIFKSFKLQNVRMHFYHVDDNFLPILRKTNVFVFYPNYFGICDKQVDYSAEKFPNLIYDAVQSFFSDPKGIATINSLRKFFPVTDGALLKTELKISKTYPKETDFEPFNTNPLSFDYKSFLFNERRFDNSYEIKTISNLSQKIFLDTDLSLLKKQRIQIFLKLHEIFASENLISIDTNCCSPFVYPLKTKNKSIITSLINDNIFILKYNYFKDIIPIPLNNDIIKQLSLYRHSF